MHTNDDNSRLAYEATRVPLADAVTQMAKRPRVVSVALGLFWILVALTAFASFAQLRSLPSITMPLAFWIIALAQFKLLAFVLLFLPQSNRWFASRQDA